ncbi:MAG: hypothetical protein LUH49_02275 [Cloacibacillus porcorum]|uniref:hypothetical protein n=1 Tax=Cloacibacillus porcorum TaxID=1197717 RepID=UPI0023F0B910|nr:hypothetical protein [Cloacibacillus porcorum]MCD7875789.1 hypothetical protein [Cloacibacillus porcorum]
MAAATRVTDGTVGTCDFGADCCPHGRAGTNATGSPDVEINDLSAHCLSHHGPCNCPHGGTFESVEGCKDVEINDLPLTTIGHSTQCMSCGKTGNHVSGSPDVEAD